MEQKYEKIISTESDLKETRKLLADANEYAADALRKLAESPNPLYRLKFERLGCHPLDVSNMQNLIEQTNQQATYEAAIDALEYLFIKHAGKSWGFAPGATGSGPDICSIDGSVIAEVFAATSPHSNNKLRDDIRKIVAIKADHRYVFYRSPVSQPKIDDRGEVTVISLGSK